MPETHFHIRWPDGSRQRCYSPSLVVQEYFTAGTSYPVGDFVRRSGEALTIAGDRVREKYGFGCSQAVAQLGEIKQRSAAFDAPGAQVLVEGFDR